jgi:hypothetical protein
MTSFFSKILRKPPEESLIGTYRIDVVSLPEELEFEEFLPIELRYVLKYSPECKEPIRKILASGKAIGIRSVLKTPENVLKAVHAISVYSQENYIITWLPELLKNKHLPLITEADRQRAKEHNENLDEAIQIILKDRLHFKRLVLIDEENVGISSEEQNLMTALSETLYPLSVDYSVYKIVADNAHERTEIAQAIVKILFIVGPIAHILEKYASGIGKVFAASADDLLGEAAEMTALRGSGFSWKELARRSFILIPVFAAAVYGAFQVEHLLETGHEIAGGILFGLSAVALSLTTAIQSLFLYRRSAHKLQQENKLSEVHNERLYHIALRQDFTNPARLGLLIGASMAPVMGMIGSLLGIMHNGFVLAAIGSTESIVAGLTVILANRINEARFRKKLLKKIVH